MSLINKMLSDLEKRDAFLNENQDQVLDGLYSAYDLELTSNKRSNSSFFISFCLVSLIITAVLFFLSFENVEFDFITSSVSNTPELEILNQEQVEKNISNAVNQKYELNTELSSKNNNEGRIINRDKKIVTESGIDSPKHEIGKEYFLKLDDSLYIKNNHNTVIAQTVNRLDSINFEVDDKGLSLLINMSDEIDYLVYGLSNPERTVVEIKNVELGFRLEDLVPVEPIVAIRYSMNDENRFKLVLESGVPININKTVANKSLDKHDLVVMMDYQPIVNGVVEKQDSELVEIVEKQVEQEKELVFKGDIVKKYVNENSDAYAESLFQQAYVSYKKGNISDSLKKLNMSLNEDAGHVKARSTLALILSEQEHFELAYSVLNEGLIQYPDNTEWIKMYARLLLNEGKVNEARIMLEKKQPEIVSNTDYYALYAAILQKQSNHEKAAKIYRDLLKVNALKGVWWVGLGISLESMKRYNDALYAYQKALNNSALVKDTREFLSHRINRLSNIIKDESA